MKFKRTENKENNKIKIVQKRIQNKGTRQNFVFLHFFQKITLKLFPSTQ